MDKLFYFIIILVIIEITFRNLYKNFPIMRSIFLLRRRPLVKGFKLDNYLASSFDHSLGWSHKIGARLPYPDSAVIDKYGSRIDSEDAITDVKQGEIWCFGDSYCFGRYVDSANSIPKILEASFGVYTRNFGVGNYGFDQALLKFESMVNWASDKDKLPQKAIMIVVPDTIVRISTSWRYFIDGNALAFKPKFKVTPSGQLKKVPCPVAIRADFLNFWESYRTCLNDDIGRRNFYNKLALRSPFSGNLIIQPVLLLKPLLQFLMLKIGGGWCSYLYHKLVSRYPPLILRHSFFGVDQEAGVILRCLIDKFENDCRSNNIEPLTVFIPMRDDLVLSEREDSLFRQYISKLAQDLRVLELTDIFMKMDDLNRLYYRSHLTVDGNRTCGQIIEKYLRRTRRGVE